MAAFEIKSKLYKLQILTSENICVNVLVQFYLLLYNVYETDFSKGSSEPRTTDIKIAFVNWKWGEMTNLSATI